MSENRFLGTLTSSSLRNLIPKSLTNKHKKNMNSLLSHTRSSKLNANCENTPPIDQNIQIDPKETLPPSITKQLTKITPKQVDESVICDSSDAPSSDPSVKVVVRIRPANSHEREGDLKKVSTDSVALGDRRLTFDSVFDSKSSQDDVFQLVGVPSVKNALAGYNTSILAYGQTGSGKTYTMWGPPSAMVDSQEVNCDQGIVPRIFQMLFSEIQREQENSEDKQINYQCRCSFLEIYNEQIGDLLDPMQRNLEIKDDAKHGFYVENLTEEYVNSYEDISQILIKGLSSRKVGATTINSKSSRSHIVFTCIIDSWCKGTSSKCFGSSKTSRITLVDLAGLERNKLDNVERQCAREEKNVKKSLSHLGHLVNILADGTSSKILEDICYTRSKLTHLLKESLGGNAKLSVICSISPDNKSSCETLSTLRFGQRAKLVENEPVINEISEDDVNDLSNQIRQLKEELIKAKSNVSYSTGNNFGYSDGRSVRGSLNLLRLSLNRSVILPSIENETTEKMNANEEDVHELRLQLESYGEKDKPDTFISVEEESDTDLASEDFGSCMDDSEMDIISLGKNQTDQQKEISELIENNLSISLSHYSPLLKDPTFSESPKIGNKNRKSITFASTHLENHDIVHESSNLELNSFRQSRKRSDLIRSSLMLSSVFPGPTESLAASLQRGLQIIDSHQKNSASNDPSVAFSFEHLALKQCLTADKANASVQTLPEEKSGSSLCSSCRRAIEFSGSNEMVVVDDDGKSNGSAVQVPKNFEEELAQAIERETVLQKFCQEQAAKIEQLSNMVAEHTKKSSLNGINDQNLTVEERKLLRWDDVEHDEQKLVKENYEIKEIMEEMDSDQKESLFDANEKEALLNEIETLKSKLQSITSVPSRISRDVRRSSLLSKSMQLRKSATFAQFNNEKEFEEEREKWMEMESDWISLTDDLRIDLENNRQRAEKVEMELRLEKKCTEELDDALHRSVLGHARMVEHYADLQEKYNELFEKHRLIMQGIADIKKAASKAGGKKGGSRFAKSMAAELSGMRVARAKEMELLRRENRSLKIQLRDTAEAVHTAGEVLVRLREAEETASLAEENATRINEENEKLRNQVEKQKRKHKMEMTTMKQYLAESRLPESALRSLYRDDSSDMAATHDSAQTYDDDEAWRAEFGAIYQHHY